MPNGYGHAGDDTVFGEPLPVPEAETEAVLGAVDALIDELDVLITGRAALRQAKLDEWAGPARTAWDEEFAYSQLDLQAVIDGLQEFLGGVAAVVEGIRAHNRSVVPPTPTGTTSTTTTSTTTTTTSTTRPGGG